MKPGVLIFLAVFSGAVALGLFLYWKLRRKVGELSTMAFGTPDLIQGFQAAERAAETTPRSLSGCDSIVIPKILRDFPDFDPIQAKTLAREALERHLRGRENLRVHNVVYVRYFGAATQKTILMQAAAQYREQGRMQQKRYDMLYAHLLQARAGEAAAAANCPQCGGALGFGAVECPYCGCRVAALLKGAWEFTEIKES